MTAHKNPAWIDELKAKGYEPYIATSKKLLPYLNTAPFGEELPIHLMEDTEDSPFLEAYMFLESYLLSNSLSFESPGLKMPHWVLIDCVLMQSAIVGFTAPKEIIPAEIAKHYENDPAIELNALKRLPVSGQICATNIGGKSMTGISLFSLGAKMKDNPGKLGFYTKMLALEVYRARDYDWFYGIAQYYNSSMKIHGCFSPEMEIYQPTVSLHPLKDLTMVYKMKPDYDPYDFKMPIAKAEPTFWMNAKDLAKKQEMMAGIKQGKRYIIAPPFSVKRDGEVVLPIIEKGV